MEDIKRINKLLGERFGKLPDGRNNFRVVWSENEFENRVGTYREYHGPLFLRESFGSMRVKKYRNICSERYVFERLITGIKLPEEVLKENPEAIKGSYEPLHVFKHPVDAEGNGDFVKPTWPMCERLAYFALYGKVLSASERTEQEIKRRKAEEDNDVARLEDAGSAFDGHLYDGSGVINVLDTPGPNLRFKR